MQAEDEDDDVEPRAVLCNAGNGVLLALVGSRKGSNRTVKGWAIAGDGTTTEWLKGPHKELFGLADAVVLGEEWLVVVTGLGIGTLRVWRVHWRTDKVDLCGTYQARHNTVESAVIRRKIGDIGEFAPWALYSVTDLGSVQEWILDVSQETILTGGVRAGTKGSRTLTKYQVREHFANDLFFLLGWEKIKRIEDFFEQFPDWKSLVPRRVLEADLYDGETDESGLPHGLGSRLVHGMSPDPITFQGKWIHGRPATGTLKPTIARWKYQGQVSELFKKHGFGTETLDVSSYIGGWRDDKQHGLSAFKQVSKRLNVIGFSQNGKRHGLSWCEQSKSPWVENKGSVRYVELHRDGEYIDMFHFHRKNRHEFRESDEEIIRQAHLPNRPNNDGGPDSIAPTIPGQRIGHFSGSCVDDCWACLEKTDPEAFVCTGCGLRVHKVCAWPPELFETSTTSKFGWFCPREDCQVTFEKSKTGQVIVFDRHGEPVLVTSKEEALSRLSFEAFFKKQDGEEDQIGNCPSSAIAYLQSKFVVVRNLVSIWSIHSLQVTRIFTVNPKTITPWLLNHA